AFAPALRIARPGGRPQDILSPGRDGILQAFRNDRSRGRDVGRLTGIGDHVEQLAATVEAVLLGTYAHMPVLMREDQPLRPALRATQQERREIHAVEWFLSDARNSGQRGQRG